MMLALLNWRVWVAVALAGALVLAGAGGYRAGKHRTQAQWDAEKVAQLNQARETERENRTIESKRQANVIDAQNAATKRLAALQADAVRSSAVVSSLRDTIRTTTANLPSRTAAAVRQYATAAAQLLAECSDRYSELAAKADGHATDSLMLQQVGAK